VTPECPEICRRHLDYMIWADDLLLAAVREKLPHRIEVLAHIFMAERIWLARIEGNVVTGFTDPPATVEELATQWAELHRKWRDWAAKQADWGKPLTYRSLAGGEYHTSYLFEIALHVGNHGSYHRGQVAAMLRAEGFAPPGTDLILWYRLHPTPAPPLQS
jgi:uncharacterized damage-inducible protein DinB